MNSCHKFSLEACLGLALLGLASCHAQQPTTPGTNTNTKTSPPPAGKAVAPGVYQIGRIDNPRITESSGVVGSRQHAGVFWTHVDGGGAKKQVLYAINREGKSLGEFFVTDALLVDWEDITLDDQNHLFIADVGNNDARRTELAVYQMDEPDPKSRQGFVRPTRVWRLRFPAAPFDCESLFVWQGYGYVVSKVFDDARAQIFRFPLTDTKDPLTLELVATTKIESPVTAASISADGRRLALVAKSGAFIYQIDGQVSKVIKGKPQQARFRHEHIEGCCFVPDGLLATAESREIFLFTEEAFQGK